MNFAFGGTVLINDFDHNEYGLSYSKWFLVHKFGYMAYIVDDDIVAMKTIEGTNLVMISLKRKVQWYKFKGNGRPNLEQFKQYLKDGTISRNEI